MAGSSSHRCQFMGREISHVKTVMEASNQELGFGAENILRENEFNNDGSYPCSGDKPFFHLFLKKSAVTCPFLMEFPSGLFSILPSRNLYATLSFKGKDIKIYFYGKRYFKGFGGHEWREFVEAQKLKEGDAIVYEIFESNNTRLHFKIQILRWPTLPEVKRGVEAREVVHESRVEIIEVDDDE